MPKNNALRERAYAMVRALPYYASHTPFMQEYMEHGDTAAVLGELMAIRYQTPAMEEAADVLLELLIVETG